jgi:DNA (cytosine-5)-methyltransferase 1
MRKQQKKTLRVGLPVVGLFAGIGGFELGMSRAGHHSTLLCENDPAAQAVLAKRFPDATLFPDITELRSLPADTAILCAGFPCQNLSSVGLKDGIRGSQSSLVGEVFRLLRRKRVKWVIFENVFFMLHLNRGAGIKYLTRELEELGYNWAYRVLDSEGFGVPQRRKRVFVVAAMDDDPRGVLFETDKESRSALKGGAKVPIGFYWTEGTYATGLAINAVPPLKGGSTIGIPSPPAILFPDGTIGTPSIRDAERLQGFPSGWTQPAESISKARNANWRLVGNAVTVPVVEWLADRIARRVSYESTGHEYPISKSETWPIAGWNVGDGAFAVDVPDQPHAVGRQGLDGFLQDSVKPLSHRAASGFLKRARLGNLRYPDGFLDAVEKYVKTTGKV